MKNKNNPIKMILTAWLCWSAIAPSNAQESGGLVQQLHAAYAKFDSTKLPAPFLLDRSPNLMNVALYASRTDTLAVATPDYLQSIMDIKNAEFKTQSLSTFPTVSDLVAARNRYLNQGLHPISLFIKEVCQIPEGLYEQGEFIGYDTINELFEFQNFTQQFEVHRIMAAGALVPYTENDELRLIFPSELIFSDYPIQRLHVEIPALKFKSDVKPNEVQLIKVGNLEYELGSFLILLTAVLDDGTIYHRKITYQRLLPIEKPDKVLYDFTLAPGCVLSTPYGLADARAFIVYSEANKGKITKPLIMVEGYDPSSVDYGAIGWRTLSTGYSYNEHGEEVYDQLRLMPQLLSELTGAGYDVIFVDFKKSGERLERNAATLARIISYIKSITESKEEIVLIGASMGGLLGQAAMNMLETSGCKTCISSFVAFDAPFQGANIPLGIQELTKFSYDYLYEARVEFEHKLNTPAARQLLYFHAVQSNERNEWLGYYATFNKKIAARNIAVLSSNNNAITFGIGEGDPLITWRATRDNNKKTEYIDIKMYSLMHFENQVLDLKLPRALRRLGRMKLGAKEFYERKFWSRYHHTYNMDNAPGSYGSFLSDAHESLVKRSQKGDLAPLVQTGPNLRHQTACFVPTVSALDLMGSHPFDNLSTYNRELGDNRSPFDLVYFSDTNVQHVMINNDNIRYLISQLSVKSILDGDYVPSANGARFNIVDASTFSLPNFSIRDGGKLQANVYARGNFGNDIGDKFPFLDKIIVRSSGCGSIVRCEGGGTIELGGIHTGSQKVFTAQLEIRNGSLLELMPDAVLRVREGSSVIIEEGATLIYHPGAKIYLEGENSVLEIRGTLQLLQGAVFTFEKGSATRGGFIRFNTPVTNNRPIRALGNNCRIDLEGENHFRDKILEICSPEGLKLFGSYTINAAFSLQQLRLRNGYVHITADNHGLDVACPVQIERINFVKEGARTATGLITHGQPLLEIKESSFENFHKGMIAQNKDLGNGLTLNQVKFRRCDHGLEVIGKVIGLNFCSFSNNIVGFISKETDGVLIGHTEFFHNTVGYAPGNGNVHTRIQSGWFLYNENGILDVNMNGLTILCTPFERNRIGITSNGKINMSPNMLIGGQLTGGSNNTFFQNEIALQLDMAEIHLANGANNFIAGNGFYYGPNTIKGSLKAGIFAPANWVLDASGNYWSNLPQGGISAGNGTLYSLIGYGSSAAPASVVFNGSALNTMNSLCFSDLRIYPNEKAPNKVEVPEFETSMNTAITGLKAYPNPTSDHVVLQATVEAQTISQVLVYDLAGKEIHRFEWLLIPGLNRLDLSMLSFAFPGVHLFKVADNEGKYQVIKVSLAH